MAFKLAGEPYLKVEGDSTKTMIQIQEEDKIEFGFLNILVDGNHLKKKEKELIALALERFFQKNYVDRAMPEAIVTVEKMKQALKDVEETIKKSSNHIVEVDAKVDSAISEMKVEVDKTVAELTTLVTSIISSVSSEEEGVENEESTE